MIFELKPHFTEKAVVLNQASNVYTFSSSQKLTKTSVKDFIKKKYNVEIQKIASLNLKGKRKVVRGNRYKTPSVYKYYLTLVAGHAIEGFYE